MGVLCALCSIDKLAKAADNTKTLPPTRRIILFSNNCELDFDGHVFIGFIDFFFYSSVVVACHEF